VPRYYFDVQNGDMVCDDRGTECPDLNGVKRHTKELIASLIWNIIQSHRDQLVCRILVRDQNGNVIYMSAVSYNGAWVDFSTRAA
jgi:hypothetical protein